MPTLLIEEKYNHQSPAQRLHDDGSEQLSFLFNEAEAYAGSAPAITAEPDLSQVKAHARKKRVVSEKKLPEIIEVEVVEKRLPEQERLVLNAESR
jgi:hypothetical protein